MPQGRLIRALLALTAAQLLNGSAPPRVGDLGRKWVARDWTPGFSLSGHWVRRGTSNVFDVEYIDRNTKAPLVWQVTVLTVQGQEVTMSATMNQDDGVKNYPVIGRILPDGRTIRGRGGWCAPHLVYCGFEAVADWTIPSGQRKTAARVAVPSGADQMAVARGVDRGKVWKVRDTTIPGFVWVGTWTFEGEHAHFRYQEERSGQAADGSMSVLLWDGVMIRVENSATRRVYEGTLQADRKTIQGTSAACKGRRDCGWTAVIQK
jgi:hypothetical protein